MLLKHRLWMLTIGLPCESSMPESSISPIQLMFGIRAFRLAQRCGALFDSVFFYDLLIGGRRA